MLTTTLSVESDIKDWIDENLSFLQEHITTQQLYDLVLKTLTNDTNRSDYRIQIQDDQAIVEYDPDFIPGQILSNWIFHRWQPGPEVQKLLDLEEKLQDKRYMANLVAKNINQNMEISYGTIFYKNKAIADVYDLIEDKQPELMDEIFYRVEEQLVEETL